MKSVYGHTEGAAGDLLGPAKIVQFGADSISKNLSGSVGASFRLGMRTLANQEVTEEDVETLKS